MARKVTRTRIADAAIEYAEARDRYNDSELDAEFGRITNDEADAAYESMQEAEQHMIGLINEWKRIYRKEDAS